MMMLNHNHLCVSLELNVWFGLSSSRQCVETINDWFSLKQGNVDICTFFHQISDTIRACLKV